jgi:drug/metabolite transporter (DMT)-like permease
MFGTLSARLSARKIADNFLRKPSAKQAATLKCVGMFVMCCIGWGLVPVMAKISSLEGVHPIGLAIQVNTFGAIILLSYSACLNRLRWPKPSEYLFFLRFALLAVVVNQVLVYWLSARIGVAHVSIFTVLEGLFVCLYAHVTRLERAMPKRFLGLTIGLCGVSLVIYEDLLSLSAIPVFVMIGAIAVPMTYAAESIMIAKRPRQMCDLVCLGYMMVTSVPLLVLMGWLTVGLETAIGKGPGVSPIALVFILISLFAYTCYFSLVRMAGPVFAGQSSYGVTLVGVFAGALMLGERMSPTFMMAVLLVFSGVFLVGIKQKEQASVGT